jgi:hypothetical protein
LIFEETADSSDFLLADFDIDDATLKSKHRAFLDDALAFMARKLSARKAATQPGSPAWKVSFDGFASHTGSRAHNVALSAQRERAVQDFLSQGTQFKRRELFNEVAFDPHFHGFDETPMQGQDPKKAGEDSLRRSVRVVIHPPDRPPRPRPIPVVVGSTTFRIKLLRAVSGGLGLTGDNAFFEIVDLKNNRSGIFQFVGGGFSVPIPKLPNISFTTAGSPKPFFTTEPVELRDFEGEAGFGTLASAGPLSTPSELTIASEAFRRKHAQTSPQPIKVPSGITVGVTLFSQTRGILVLHKEGPG